MAQLKQFVVKSAVQVRDDILRTIKNGLVRQGVSSPNVGPSTDWYLIATSLGNELAVVGANAIVKCDDQMPDTAVTTGLARIATLLGLTKQSAKGSIGGVIITSSATTTIATNAQLSDSLGQRFAVTTGGTYATGARVPIYAISTGFSTNHAAGDVLQWASSPPYCSSKVTVATGDLVNGIDAEDDEALRERVLAALQVPPGSGNWEHVATVTEAADPRVQKAFVYPAVQGPATMDVAVAAAPTTTSKSRVVASTIVNGTVYPYARGKLPEHAALTVTSCADLNADVAIGLSLPEAATANPQGPGGGWTNGTPWPTPDASTTFRCTVTAVTSATSFTVDAATSPTVNVTRVAWLSPTTWTLYTALVTAVSGTTGAYIVTLDSPFTGITTGCYVWPEAQNGQAYVDAVLAYFALMGPGEKTSNASALQRGFRHPTPAASWNSSLGPAMLRAITDAQEEVQAAEFLHRTDGTTTSTTPAGQVMPPVAVTLASEPNIYTPRNIGFYRIP
jgi:hypothetical protein